MNDKVEKWTRWVRTIQEDMRDQAGSRLIYRESMELILANPAVRNGRVFLSFMEQWYIDSTVMGLRRQLKTDADSVSLAGLLGDMAANANLLTRARFVAMYDVDDRHHAENVFDRYVHPGADTLDATAVRADIAKLKGLAQTCEAYADRFLAHRDRRGVTTHPTYAELNQAIAWAEELLEKYFLQLTGNSVEMVPVFDTTWKLVFDRPWRSSAVAN